MIQVVAVLDRVGFDMGLLDKAFTIIGRNQKIDELKYRRQIDEAYCEGAQKERELIKARLMQMLENSDNELYDGTAKQLLMFLEKRCNWRR